MKMAKDDYEEAHNIFRVDFPWNYKCDILYDKIFKYITFNLQITPSCSRNKVN